MDGRTLIRMRVAFVGLAVALLLPLALLVRSAAARLEEQRRLKHEVVAERIFDELERELAALLERERARPSGAYAATQTRAETWAPFVVGYFTHDAGGARVTARDQLTAERAALVTAAAGRAWEQRPRPAPAATMEPAELSPEDTPTAVRASSAAASDEAMMRVAGKRKAIAPKQEAVLRQLNRSGAKKSPAPAKAAKELQMSPYRNDPLSGLDDL